MRSQRLELQHSFDLMVNVRDAPTSQSADADQEVVLIPPKFAIVNDLIPVFLRLFCCQRLLYIRD